MADDPLPTLDHEINPIEGLDDPCRCDVVALNRSISMRPMAPVRWMFEKNPPETICDGRYHP